MSPDDTVVISLIVVPEDWEMTEEQFKLYCEQTGRDFDEGMLFVTHFYENHRGDVPGNDAYRCRFNLFLQAGAQFDGEEMAYMQETGWLRIVMLGNDPAYTGSQLVGYPTVGSI